MADSNEPDSVSGQPSKKSKRDSTPVPVCMVHVPGQKSDKYGEVKLFSSKNDGEDTLAKLQGIKRKRLAEPLTSPYRMTDICKQIPDELSPNHGYHRECYKRFTMNLTRLALKADQQESTSRPARKSGDNIVFTPECIFCNSEKRKKIKVKGSWTTEGLSGFEFGGWQDLEKDAELRNDEKLLTRIRGKDLFACEAKYHRSCRKSYHTQDPKSWRSDSDEQRKTQRALEDAHSFAFGKVCELIDKELLINKRMIQLRDLRRLYIAHLEETDFPNPEYRSSKLKDKLQNHLKYSSTLSYCQMKEAGPQYHGYIVYSSGMSIDEAIRKAFELGSSDIMKESGNHLHDVIHQSFKESKDLTWPPNALELEQNSKIPPELETFLSHVIAKQSVPTTPKNQRLILSIGQDLCRAATAGEWKLGKHLLLSMTLRHLYRSEQLVTLLNRMGHCENYSFTVELETGLAKAIGETSTLLSTQIVRAPEPKSVFHSEFDNFDQLLNSATGKDSIHTAHGIMLQDIEGPSESHSGIHIELPSIERTKQRSLIVETPHMPECYITVRQSPKLTITHTTHPGGENAFYVASLKQMLWILARIEGQASQKPVPGITGFLSKTGKTPRSLTTIDYYPVIASPITEYKTVQECLRYAESATHEVQQRYTITTFDLGVCMKAYPITWNNPERYEHHIILIGTFHLTCAFMRMLGKKMDGSGFSDILLEAGLIGTGSIQGVLSGKHYERALHCHKVLAEALKQLLFLQYKDSQGVVLSQECQMILNDVVATGSPAAIESAVKNVALRAYLDNFLAYREECRRGSLGKTAQFWLSYMDHVRLILALNHAVKHNNFPLYVHCVHEMAPMFFSFNGQNYARYLSYFSMLLCNIETSHPGATDLLKQGAISVARSFIPDNCSDVDKTMEETFMRHAKSRGSSGCGITGILTNQEAYQRWVRTTHTRSQFVNSMLNLANMQQSESHEHRDMRPTERARSQRNTSKAIEAVQSFLNPFTVDTKDKLLIISSGQAATDDIERDVLRAENVGTAARDAFIEDRLKNNKNFFEPVKRQNLKTLGRMNKKSTMKSLDNKVVQFKQQGNVAFQLFLRCQQLGIQVKLDELVEFPLTPVPYCLATADGFFCKTDKSTTFQHLTQGMADVTEPIVNGTLTIYDGNACFYILKDVPSNFLLIGQKVFGMMGKTGDTVFSTDSYVPDSVKVTSDQIYILIHLPFCAIKVMHT